MIQRHGQPPAPAVVRPVAEATINRRAMICALCAWNVAWICEHSGCKPCGQRAAGGLPAKIERPHETCPAGKWQ